MIGEQHDYSFLAEPSGVADWRMVLLADAADQAGLIDALPGTATGLADRLDLDAHAVDVLLEALSVFGVVARDHEGRYDLGPQALGADALATISHHARVIGRWAGTIGPRVRGEVPMSDGPPVDRSRWLDALGVNGRRQAPEVVDTCLQRVPDAQTVLDLGGCHGEYALEFARRGLKATMQDRPTMIDIVRRRGTLEAAGIELFAGDFFESTPGGPFDLVFCSGVTNTFGPDRNRALYRNVHRMLSPTGSFVISTSVQGQHSAGKLFAVQMLCTGNGGGTHPETDYRSWLSESGFGPVETVHLDGGRRTLLFAPVA